MNSLVKVSILVFLVFSCLAGVSRAQKPDSADSSLGDLARKVRSEKAKEAQPPKVFTNDNLPTAGAGQNPEAAPGTANSSEKKPEKAATETKGKGEEKPSAEAEDVHDEKYYRKQMGELQSKLDTHKRELNVLQQKLDINQVQYYNDPYKTLEQEYSRADISKLTQEVDAKKAEILRTL